jgi:hypothetical protein
MATAMAMATETATETNASGIPSFALKRAAPHPFRSSIAEWVGLARNHRVSTWNARMNGL